MNEKSGGDTKITNPIASATGQGGSAKLGGVLVLAAFLMIGILTQLLSGKEEQASASVPKAATAQIATTTAQSKTTDLRRGLIEGEQVGVEFRSATSLFRDYERNEVATDMRLNGKIVEVQGVVTGINKNFLDQPYVTLRTPNEFMPASMHTVASDTGSVARLMKGQQAVFRCEKMRRVMGSPSGSRCVLMN